MLKRLQQIWQQLVGQNDPPPLPEIAWDAAPLSELLVKLHEDPVLRPALGIEECKTLLRLLSAGADSPAALDDLLAALLVKNPNDRHTTRPLLEKHLQQYATALRIEWTEIIRQLELAGKAEAENPIETDRDDRARRGADKKQDDARKTDTTTAGSTLQERYETSVKVEVTISPNKTALPELTDSDEDEADETIALPQGHRFILTDDYQPVTRRQMDQIWRFLRKPSRTGGRAGEVDLHRTVERFARQGWLDQPEWQRDKVNKVHLVILIDRSNSMVAWHTLGEQLIASARLGGGHKTAEVLWFSNQPLQFKSEQQPGLLFKDPARLKPEKMEKLLRRCSKQDTEVLIFSDGGAARGAMNPERAELTKAWLKVLKKNVSSVAWLNPMPMRRWGNNTAGITQFEVAMFQADPHGLMAAINHLRGR